MSNIPLTQAETLELLEEVFPGRRVMPPDPEIAGVFAGSYRVQMDSMRQTHRVMEVLRWCGVPDDGYTLLHRENALYIAADTAQSPKFEEILRDCGNLEKIQQACVSERMDTPSLPGMKGAEGGEVVQIFGGSPNLGSPLDHLTEERVGKVLGRIETPNLTVEKIVAEGPKSPGERRGTGTGEDMQR